MKRWLRGSVVLVTAVAWSCSSDPTDSFRNGTDTIVASPSSVFLAEGETVPVLVQAIDDQGNPQAVDFQVAVGQGITVVKDTTFLPTNGAPIQGQTRYLVTANTFTGTSFTVTADGKSLEIPVRSLPVAFTGAFSNVAPALGDTVTLTAPAGVTFSDTASITFPGAAGEPVITGISEDHTVLSFLPAPGTDTTGFVSGLDLTFAVGVPVDTLPTSTKLTTPAVTEIPANFSTTGPAVNQEVTVTAPGFIFLPTSRVTIVPADTLLPPDSAVVTSVAADGSSLTFVGNPGSTGVPTISGAALTILPQVSLTLPSTTTVTVGTSIPSFGGSSPAAAPDYPVPAEGFSNKLFAAGSFTGADISTDGGIGGQYYKLVVADSGDYTFTVDWDATDPTTDIDMELCSDVTCSDGGDFLGSGVDKPETDVRTLGPGTYYFDVVLFGGGVPSSFSLRVDHAPPSE
jgi:hypothetical protein